MPLLVSVDWNVFIFFSERKRKKSGTYTMEGAQNHLYKQYLNKQKCSESGAYNSEENGPLKTVIAPFILNCSGTYTTNRGPKKVIKIMVPKHKGFPMTHFCNSFWQQQSYVRKKFSVQFHWKRRSRRVLTIVVMNPNGSFFKKGWVLHSNRGPMSVWFWIWSVKVMKP